MKLGFGTIALPTYWCSAADAQTVGRQPSLLYQLPATIYRATISRGDRAPEGIYQLLREQHVIQASLKDFVITGQLGPIHLGCARTLITELLGEPDHYSLNSRARQRKRSPPAIWKYGDIELHFAEETDQLYLIFLEHFAIPSGGAKLQLDPWIIEQSLTVDTLEQGLEQNHIPVQRERRAYDDAHTLRLRAGVGVEFLFTLTDRSERSLSGLTAVSYSARASSSQL